MGRLGGDPNKKTLLVYGHLDVQPALKEDGWDYEPFVVRTASLLGPVFHEGGSQNGT